MQKVEFWTLVGSHGLETYDGIVWPITRLRALRIGSSEGHGLP